MKFTKPEMKIIYFDAEDIIVTSGSCEIHCNGDGNVLCNSDIADTGCTKDVLN